MFEEAIEYRWLRQQMLHILLVLIDFITLVYEILVQGVGKDGDGLRLLKVYAGVEPHSFDHRLVEAFGFLSENFPSRNDTVRVSSQELKHPKVIWTVGCASLQIDRKELLVLIHVTGGRVDNFRVTEEGRPTEV